MCKHNRSSSRSTLGALHLRLYCRSSILIRLYESIYTIDQQLNFNITFFGYSLNSYKLLYPLRIIMLNTKVRVYPLYYLMITIILHQIDTRVSFQYYIHNFLRLLLHHVKILPVFKSNTIHPSDEINDNI